MPSDKSTEELVDRMINKAQKDEIQSVLSERKITPVSIMKLPDEVKMVDGVECLSGLGDTDAIESIIQRHIETRKFRNK